jgi:hypothetical protein
VNLGVTVAAAALSLLPAATAGATIPTGNLVKNPGAEDGQAAANDSDYFFPPGWKPELTQSRITAVQYGTGTDFLTTDQGIAYAGGGRFFAGGPPRRLDETQQSDEPMYQDVAIPGDALVDVDAGVVEATGGGCFGGFADDVIDFTAQFLDEGGRAMPGVMFLEGPTNSKPAALQPTWQTMTVPAGARAIHVRLQFFQIGPRGYNRAYADNVLMALSRAGSAPPQPTCSVQTPPAGPTGPTGPAAPGPAPQGPPLTPFLISRGSSKATLRSGRVGVSLACTASGRACRGSLRLSVPSLSAGASSVTLGSRSFTIAAGKRAVVSVRLGRRAKARLSRLPARKVARLKVTARVTMGSTSTKFALRLREAR